MATSQLTTQEFKEKVFNYETEKDWKYSGKLPAIINLAISYSATGHHDEALKLGEEALPLHRKMLGSEHPDTLKLMTALVGFNSAAGRQEEAARAR